MTDSIADTSMDEPVNEEVPEPEPQGMGSGGGNTSLNNIKDLLLADAPDNGTDYVNHALNFDKTESTAKIIRGFEGMLGNLNKAVVLIVIGVIEKATGKESGGDGNETGITADNTSEGF